MVHASSCSSLLFCFPGIVWALWKVKELDFNPQLSARLGKTWLLCWHQGREGKAPAEKRGAWLLHGLTKTFQYLARGGGVGWGETVLLSYIPQEGRDISSEKCCPPNPVPPSCPPLQWSWGQERRQHAAKEEKTENTAGNWKGNQNYWVIFFFFIKCT